MRKMLLILGMFPQLQAQSARIKAIAAELDRKLALRYGDRYQQIKQQLDRQLESSKTWYEKTKAEAQATGTVPLDRQHEETDRQFARAGAGAARKEAALKQQLKDLWQNLKKR
jgi:hypothetical protein